MFQLKINTLRNIRWQTVLRSEGNIKINLMKWESGKPLIAAKIEKGNAAREQKTIYHSNVKMIMLVKRLPQSPISFFHKKKQALLTEDKENNTWGYSYFKPFPGVFFMVVSAFNFHCNFNCEGTVGK